MNTLLNIKFNTDNEMVVVADPNEDTVEVQIIIAASPFDNEAETVKKFQGISAATIQEAIVFALEETKRFVTNDSSIMEEVLEAAASE